MVTRGIVLLCLAALTACDAAPRDHSWLVSFASDADRDAAERVCSRVREGGCDGPVLFETCSARDEDSMMAPALPAGTYGVEAEAFGEGCAPVARGCVEVQLPLDPAELEVSMTSAPGVCDGACVDGVCRLCPDGGCPLDGGGPLDAGPDSGGVDASPMDASTADAGPTDGGQPDAGPPPSPRIISPWNGVRTGSARATDDADGPSQHPLRPRVLFEEVPGAGAYRAQYTPCSGVDASSCDFEGPGVITVDVGPDAREAAPTDLLPVETLLPPLGARWGVRVGACTDMTASDCVFSAARYIDVGRTRGDTDGDGDADVYLVNTPTSADAQLRHVTGFIGTATELVAEFAGLRRITQVGDIDGDGLEELLASTTDSVALFDDGAVGTTMDVASFEFVGVGDVDGDGYADFAMNVGEEVWVQLGGASFDSGRRVVIAAPSHVTQHGRRIAPAGDIDGDGLADLVVAARATFDAVELQVYSLAGRAAVAVGAPELVATGEAGVTSGFPIELTGGFDMDGDGRPEFAVLRRLIDTVTVFFAALPRANAMGFSADLQGSIGIGMLDGTRRARVIVGSPEHSAFSGRETGGTFHIRYSGDPLAITGLGYFNEDHFGRRVVAGDFEGDGFEDIASLGDVLHFAMFDADSVGTRDGFVFVPSGGRWTELSR